MVNNASFNKIQYDFSNNILRKARGSEGNGE